MIIQPSDYVVPIIAIDASYKIKHFLGTGTFIEDGKFLLTAHHVIKDWNGLFAIAYITDLKKIYVAEVLAIDRDADLALLIVPSSSVKKGLTLGNENEVKFNQ